jgi:hypothetical protein
VATGPPEQSPGSVSYGRAEVFLFRLGPGTRDTLSLAVIYFARPYQSLFTGAVHFSRLIPG